LIGLEEKYMSGKGSRPRPYSVDNETFASNWDRIFSKKSGMVGRMKYAIKVSTNDSFYYITEDTGSCADLVVELFETREEAEETANTIRAAGCGGTVEIIQWLD